MDKTQERRGKDKETKARARSGSLRCFLHFFETTREGGLFLCLQISD